MLDATGRPRRSLGKRGRSCALELVVIRPHSSPPSFDANQIRLASAEELATPLMPEAENRFHDPLHECKEGRTDHFPRAVPGPGSRKRSLSPTCDRVPRRAVGESRKMSMRKDWCLFPVQNPSRFLFSVPFASVLARSLNPFVNTAKLLPVSS